MKKNEYKPFLTLFNKNYYIKVYIYIYIFIIFFYIYNFFFYLNNLYKKFNLLK